MNRTALLLLTPALAFAVPALAAPGEGAASRGADMHEAHSQADHAAHEQAEHASSAGEHDSKGLGETTREAAQGQQDGAAKGIGDGQRTLARRHGKPEVKPSGAPTQSATAGNSGRVRHGRGRRH